MRNKIWLLLWTAGILFPMAWLGQFSTPFRGAFDTIFGPVWVHIFMHAWLYAGFAILLLVLAKSQPFWWSLALVLAAILLVAFLQEIFQALSNGAFSLAGSAFDLGVDLAGGMLGIFLKQVMDLLRRNPGRTGHPGKTRLP